MNDPNPTGGEAKELHSNADEQIPREIAGSPAGSQTSRSSSSRRENRVVELLPEAENRHDEEDNWMIGAEFYDEDVVAGILDDHMSDDERESVHSEVEQEFVQPEAHSDDEEFIEMEYVQEESEDDDEDEQSNEDREDYDISLPAGHRYLGENLEEFRGRQILVDNSTVQLCIFNMPDIVLLPGQVLPITTSSMVPRVQMLLRTCINNGVTLVGLMSRMAENSIGVTAEIRNCSTRAEDDVRIILEGRQRFVLLSPSFETAIEGTIKILPELSLGRPFPLMPSWRKLITGFAETPRRYAVTKHPYWLAKRYEANSLMKRIIEQTHSWYDGDPSRDPNDFSYWIASNLPMSNYERLAVLTFNCTEARLLWVLNMLEKSEFLGCSACKNVICHKEDVFPMSSNGPQNSFVNSGGYVHDTMTVKSARGLIHDNNNWSTEFSWFPGYSWRIASCENCGRHIGWCYKSSHAATRPKKFYGLSRANVRLQSRGELREQVYVIEM